MTAFPITIPITFLSIFALDLTVSENPLPTDELKFVDVQQQAHTVMRKDFVNWQYDEKVRAFSLFLVLVSGHSVLLLLLLKSAYST